MQRVCYPNSDTEMPQYRQFQDVHAVRHKDVLKWWVNSKQITIDQLSIEQRRILNISPMFKQLPIPLKQNEVPEEVTFGEVYKKYQ